MERDVVTVTGTQGDEPSSASSRVLIVMEHGVLSRYQLPATGTIRIGRAEDSDVVHVMRRDVRERYDLESLWGDAPRIRTRKKAAAKG